MKRQPVAAQKAEISFRSKLAQQQVHGGRWFRDELSQERIERVLRERMGATLERMASLSRRGVDIGTYVEIGAERCQRSLVMENDLRASGAAVDISFDMLKTCDHYSSVFSKAKLPTRLCCDAGNLPFMSDSVPFVFCYQTLHHFPEPSTVVREIHRVLSPGGCFFFDEEPYRRVLHLDLYRGSKVYSRQSLEASTVRKLLDYFLSRRSSNELEYGVIENDRIPLRVWTAALSAFGHREIELCSLNVIRAKLSDRKRGARLALAWLLGGRISATCRKSGVRARREILIRDLLVCPQCIRDGHEPKLNQRDGSFCCDLCGRRFPVVDGVAFLFSDETFQELYPQVFSGRAQ